MQDTRSQRLHEANGSFHEREADTLDEIATGLPVERVDGIDVVCEVVDEV